MIEAWTCGGVLESDECAFSVYMKDSDDTMHKTYKLDNKITKNQADLLALEFALRAIKDHSTPTKIHIHNKYVTDIMERKDGEWVKNATANKEFVDTVRDLYLTFIDLELILDTESENMKEVYLYSRGKQ